MALNDDIRIFTIILVSIFTLGFISGSVLGAIFAVKYISTISFYVLVGWSFMVVLFGGGSCMANHYMHGDWKVGLITYCLGFILGLFWVAGSF